MNEQNKASHKREKREPKVVLVTGGAGFIGSNFIDYLLTGGGYVGTVVNVDVLTYAGNLESLSEVDRVYGERGEGRYFFHRADICDGVAMEKIIRDRHVDMIIHFAAESHVDRSIHGPKDFINTNIMGTFSLLEILRKLKTEGKDIHFHHVSTDEVYGSLGDTGYFYETTAYDPRSPYSASKASSDHLVNAYAHTYGIGITMSNCSNNYGRYQFPEKLIPLMILNALNGKDLPVYGDGMNVRDWLYVGDHCSAIWSVACAGGLGETYNVGGENEETNINVVKGICDVLGQMLPVEKNEAFKKARPDLKSYGELIVYVKDRPGHDRRYAINCDKIKAELNWAPSVTFQQGLRETVGWYLDNTAWIDGIRSGEYKTWLEKNYGHR